MSSREDEVMERQAPEQVRRLCTTCMKVNVCKAFEHTVNVAKSYDSYDFVKFPFPAEQIALTCSEYLSPIANHNTDQAGR